MPSPGQDNNFDNIVEAMITLVEMTTFEMWPDLMFKGEHCVYVCVCVRACVRERARE